MSPEQVRGKEVDARTDIFAFGAILYEMLSGRRAFKGESSIETMNAILKDDPPELSADNLRISPGLERIVRRCLEKEPARRFDSARDVGFALEAISGTSSTSAITGTRSASRAPTLVESCSAGDDCRRSRARGVLPGTQSREGFRRFLPATHLRAGLRGTGKVHPRRQHRCVLGVVERRSQAAVLTAQQTASRGRHSTSMPTCSASPTTATWQSF